jgi:hypothetical protein
MSAAEGVGTPTPLQRFFVTFGVMYRHETHPYWAGAHPDGWLLVLAPDEEAARHRVRMFIGLKWAFLYDVQRFRDDDVRYYPKGELAVISTDGDDQPGVGAPTRRFGTSSPEYYGHDDTEIVACRIEGILKENSDRDCVEALGYEAELVHLHCFVEGVALFKSVSEVDRAVQAGELDWADPHECPICETSIT